MNSANSKTPQTFGGPNIANRTFESALMFSEQARKFPLICRRHSLFGNHVDVTLELKNSAYFFYRFKCFEIENLSASALAPFFGG